MPLATILSVLGMVWKFLKPIWEPARKLLAMPKLALSTLEPRCRERVTVIYDSTRYEGIWLRTFVSNRGLWVAAKDCSVLVTRIEFSGTVLEDESSSLQWTDKDTFEPQMLATGMGRGLYVDVCSADARNQELRIASQKSTKGYHLYDVSGVYVIEVEAVAPESNAGSLRLRVNYEHGNYEAIKFLSNK